MAALRSSLLLHLVLRRRDHILRWLLHLILLRLGYLPLWDELSLWMQITWLLQPRRMLYLHLLLLQALASPRRAKRATRFALLQPAAGLRRRCLCSSRLRWHLCRNFLCFRCCSMVVKNHLDAVHLDSVDAGDA